MSTPNGAWMSSTEGNGNSFFSTISNIFNAGASIASNIGNITSGNTPLWAGGNGQPPNPVRQEPTYQGGGNTTATVSNPTNYLPYILGGVGLLAAILLVKG